MLHNNDFYYINKISFREVKCFYFNNINFKQNNYILYVYIILFYQHNTITRIYYDTRGGGKWNK